VLAFIKDLFKRRETAKPLRQFPIKDVDPDVSYRDKYEEQLRNEIAFLKDIIARSREPQVAQEFKPTFHMPMSNGQLADQPQVSIPASYVPFASIKHALEAKLKKVSPKKDQ
jgi:hypothetical protein